MTGSQQHEQHLDAQAEAEQALRIVRRMIRVRRQYRGAGSTRRRNRIPTLTGK